MRRSSRLRIVGVAVVAVACGCLVLQALASPIQPVVNSDQVVLVDASSNATVAADALSVLTLSGTVGIPKPGVEDNVPRVLRLTNSPFFPRR